MSGALLTDRSNNQRAASDDARARGVLMIACAFPPTGGPGVQRTVKFAKYLPRFGWRPIVWAADELAGLPRDETLLADLPNTVAICRHPPPAAMPPALPMLPAAVPTVPILSRLANAAARRWIGSGAATPFPDEFASWAQGSVEPLLRRIDREAVMVLYSTFSPASNHLLALELKRQTGLPWVADFRDLWIDDYRYTERSHRRRIDDAALQRAILAEADVVIGIAPRQTQILAGHVPQHAEKFITITNGFDPDDFRGRTPAVTTNDQQFVLAHVGRLDRWRSKPSLLEGLRRAAEVCRSRQERFLFRVVGHVDATVRTRLLDAGVAAEFTGYVTHIEAIGQMRAADALLLPVPEGPNAESVIPAKLFEYLASSRPILTVGPDGAAAELVRECGAGLTVGFNGEAIAAALATIVHASLTGRPLPGCDPALLTPFSRIVQTARLAGVFERLTAGSRNSAEAKRPRVTEHAR